MAEDGEIDATVTLPALPLGASYGALTTGGDLIMTNLSVSGTTLTYTAPAGTSGQTGTITIPVTNATNYKAFDITVTVTYTAKIPQAISFTNAIVNKTYGDAKFTQAVTETTVNGTITYASDDTATATVDSTGEVTIVGYGTNGSATITATAKETPTHAEATASYTVNVAKKQLTITAEDKVMYRYHNIPKLTLTYSGFVDGEDETSAFAKNSYVFTNVRSNQTIHATFKKASHVNPQTGVDVR